MGWGVGEEAGAAESGSDTEAMSWARRPTPGSRASTRRRRRVRTSTGDASCSSQFRGVSKHRSEPAVCDMPCEKGKERTGKERMELEGKAAPVGDYTGTSARNQWQPLQCDPIGDSTGKWTEAQSTERSSLVPGGCTHLSRCLCTLQSVGSARTGVAASQSYALLVAF